MTLATPATIPDAVAGAARYDIYAGIHRALRLFMTDTLGRLGRLDPDDADETGATLEQLTRLLTFCRHHLDKENRFVHPAIEARLPGRSGRIAGEHAEHVDEIAALEAEAALLRAAPTAARALRLYRGFALFVAANLRHMHVEETALNEALWSTYRDDEIEAIARRIVAGLGAEESATVLRWMTCALPPAERAQWFAGLQRELPPEAFRGLLDAARNVLDDRAWAKLARSLGLAPVPGLVGV